MEIFRNILRAALEQAPTSLVLAAGSKPRMGRDGQLRELTEFDELAPQAVTSIIESLQPQQPAGGAPGTSGGARATVRGQLRIKDWGALPWSGTLSGSPRLEIQVLSKGAPTTAHGRSEDTGPTLPKVDRQEARAASLRPDAQSSASREVPSSPAQSPADNWDALIEAAFSAPGPAATPRGGADASRIRYTNRDGGLASNGQNAIDSLLHSMVRKRASDLHVTLGAPVAMRIDGDIQRIGERPVDERQMAAWFDAIIPQRNAVEFAETNDTDFAYEVPGLGRFRVNMFRDHQGVGAVMRLIPADVLSFEKLGLPDGVRELCTLTKGLVIVTGPTGSGKSTTLAALIDLVNRTRTDHIITIEDPIEFVHKQKQCLIHQREVHRHTRSFAAALRAALREDPDIVLIGELRDEETIGTAIETAETGHLVFGTLHTNTAISTVDRLVDTFPTEAQSQVRAMLSESLRGVIAQTLVKKIGGGRAAAYEILMCDRATSAMIREGKTQMLVSRMQTQRAQGNRLLNQSLLDLVVEGIVEAEEALRKAVDKPGLAALYQAKGVSCEPASAYLAERN
jgi:twitching motility protein PilT